MYAVIMSECGAEVEGLILTGQLCRVAGLGITGGRTEGLVML